MLAHRLTADREASARVVEQILMLAPPRAAIVAAFWPLPDEVDLRAAIHALHARGLAVALPVTPARGHKLTFRAWTPAAPMQPGRFGTQHPGGPELTPDWLLVPLLAFDADCNRLGYGAGYYDRTLAALPGRRAIGCAFAVQQVDRVPVGPDDVPLDAVVTDRGIIERRA